MISAVKHVKCSSKQFHDFNTNQNCQQHECRIKFKQSMKNLMNLSWLNEKSLIKSLTWLHWAIVPDSEHQVMFPSAFCLPGNLTNQRFKPYNLVIDHHMTFGVVVKPLHSLRSLFVPGHQPVYQPWSIYQLYFTARSINLTYQVDDSRSTNWIATLHS